MSAMPELEPSSGEARKSVGLLKKHPTGTLREGVRTQSMQTQLIGRCVWMEYVEMYSRATPCLLVLALPRGVDKLSQARATELRRPLKALNARTLHGAVAATIGATIGPTPRKEKGTVPLTFFP